MYQNVQKRTLSAINYWRTIDQVMHFEKVSLIKIEKIPDKVRVIMPFKYTDGKENSLYAWRAFSYGKKIEIFC